MHMQQKQTYKQEVPLEIETALRFGILWEVQGALLGTVIVWNQSSGAMICNSEHF